MVIDRSSYMGAFREEILEHLQAVTQCLLFLEAHPEDTSSISELFRRVHTIKGSARMMGFGPMADLAHGMEDLLEELRSGRLRVSSSLLDAMLASVDLLRGLLDGPVDSKEERPDLQAMLHWLAELRGGRERAEPAGRIQEPLQRSGAEQVARIEAQTVRVDVSRIDAILNLASELMVLDAARRQWLAEVARLLDELEKVPGLFQGAGARDLSRNMARPSLLGARAGNRFRRMMAEQTELMRELHYQVSALRMMPARSILAAIPRAARDLARDEGKEVEVLIEGEDTQVDREVLDRVRSPILHLVRNAVHHGIEDPVSRTAAGKPRAGKIRVSLASKGELAILQVEDDGCGVDLQAVRRAAVERGLLSPSEAESLESEEVMDLLFVPGFSTSDVVSEGSGRGVGLDVVKAEMDAIKGRVHLESHPGRGTRITLEMPITLAFTHVLLVEVGRSVYGVPAASTQGIAEIPTAAVRLLQSREAVELAGRTVPVVRVQSLLGVESTLRNGAARFPALLLGSAERPVAFAVDQVVGDENVIVKPLGPLLRSVPWVSGGFILGDGRVALLLSAAALMDAAHRGDAVQAARSQPVGGGRRGRGRVLVVDDAAISRELVKAILQSAGYEVESAADGVDALSRLRVDDFDLVVADVEMPRMDGLELTAALRLDPRLAGLPVVILSAKESEEDRKKGLEMGAQAYIGKGSFDRADLLDTVKSLIG